MKEEELIFTDMFGKKMRPIEWLQYLADSFIGLAVMWDEYSCDYLEDDLESYKVESPKVSKIAMYGEIAHYIDERLLHDHYSESDSMIAEILHGKNKECLLKAFEGSVVFVSILDAIGTVECVRNEAKSAQDQFYYYQYYWFVSSPEEAEELFGNGAGKRFKKNPKLTVEDYEEALSCITEFLERMEEGRFLHNLREAAWRIKAYCKLKVGTPEYEQTEERIANRYEQSYRTYEYAENKLSETDQKTVTDRQAYDYLREYGFEGSDDYEIPDNFDTWQRYVRRGRSKHGTQKNTPRAGRSHGRSVVKSDEIQSISDISSQYTKED